MLVGFQGVKYKARTIYEVLMDDSVYLYFTFLSPIVLEFEKVSVLFQSANPDPAMMSRELNIHCKALKSRIFNRRGEKLCILMTAFGEQFEGELARCCKEHQSNAVFAADVRALKERCHTFLMDLINETEK